MNEKQNLLRNLPSVDRVLNEPVLADLGEEIPPVLIKEAAQESIARLRREILEANELPSGTTVHPSAVAQRALGLVKASSSASLRPVINATGTLLHTNLGRAPLSDKALAAVDAVARSYSNLEIKLESGKRGHRYSHVEQLLCRLTGAEAATVVNNNAGAVLLALTALARGSEAVVSRGELVEIGGAFRVPEVMEAGGVSLREVGTTNKTHLRDYRQAVTEETGLLMKIHTSNFRILGFTKAVSGAELAELGSETGIPVMEDLGSGMLMDLSPFGLPREPTVSESVASGLDVVTFSGDKLLGGPQAGLIVGRTWAVDKIRSHPMARALRIDKLTLAALEATLRHYLDPQRAIGDIPVLRMLDISTGELKRRCGSLVRRLKSRLEDRAKLHIIEETSTVGGGALPLTELPGTAVALTPASHSIDTVARRLRLGKPAVVVRIHEGRIILNPRTIAKAEEKSLVEAVAAAFSDEEAH
ncbi:MAG: L-seryl-tRNA(Sec) selenium transferase [Desulfuromonadales bacterium]